MGERMRVEAREPILDRMPLAYNLAWRATSALDNLAWRAPRIFIPYPVVAEPSCGTRLCSRGGVPELRRRRDCTHLD